MRLRIATCFAALLVSAASPDPGNPAPRPPAPSHGGTADPSKAKSRPAKQGLDEFLKNEFVKKPAPRPPAWINADACPEPLSALGDSSLEPYEALMNQALKLPPSAEELFAIRISPSFAVDQTLSLSRPRGSVLALAVSSAEHLLRFVDADMRSKEGEKAIARKEMQSALKRTRRKEPCLREYKGEFD